MKNLGKNFVSMVNILKILYLILLHKTVTFRKAYSSIICYAVMQQSQKFSLFNRNATLYYQDQDEFFSSIV